MLVLGSAESESGFMGLPREPGPPRAWGSGSLPHCRLIPGPLTPVAGDGCLPRGHQLPLPAGGHARLSGADLTCGFEITKPRKGVGVVAWPLHPCLPAGSTAARGRHICSRSWPSATSGPGSAGAASLGGWRARSRGPLVLWRCFQVHLRAGGGQLFHTHSKDHLKGSGVN